MDLRIGCGPFPAAQKKYLKAFKTVEVNETFTGFLTPAVIKRWRDVAPSDFTYITTAPQWLTHDPLSFPAAPPEDLREQGLGLMQPSDVNRRIWARVHEQSIALGNADVLLKTPTTFFPSRKNRRNFADFVEDVIGEVPYRVMWEPRGVWDPDEALELAEELGLVIGRDPYVDPELPTVPSGDALYILTAPRGRRRFDDDDFEDLFDFLAEHEGLVDVLFRGPDRERHANALQRIARELAEE